MTPEAIGLSLLSAALSFVAALFFMHHNDQNSIVKTAREERRRADDRIMELEKQLSMVNQLVVPLNTAFQAMLIKELTHYHTPELDELMQKLDPYTLTAKEFVRMKALLRRRTQDMNGRIDRQERGAALILPEVIRRVANEIDLDTSKQAIQVVTVPPDKDE